MNACSAIRSTRSYEASTGAMATAAGLSIPRQSGWSGGKTPRPWSGAPKTGAPIASATATAAPTAPDAATVSPTTMATFPTAGPVRRSASSSRLPATAARSMVEGGGAADATSWSRRSIGRDANTGPPGAWAAS